LSTPLNPLKREFCDGIKLILSLLHIDSGYFDRSLRFVLLIGVNTVLTANAHVIVDRLRMGM